MNSKKRRPEKSDPESTQNAKHVMQNVGAGPQPQRRLEERTMPFGIMAMEELPWNLKYGAQMEWDD